MRIIIVGCGKVGLTLVRQLSEEGHDVTVIDSDAELVRRVSAVYDVLGLSGNGISYKLLKEANIENADILIAVTNSDETNLLCCMIAKQSPCKTIARVRNPIYLEERAIIQKDMDISMIINPDRSAAHRIRGLIQIPSALSLNSFANGRIEMMAFRITDDSPLVGVLLKESGLQKSGILICAVQRNGRTFIPNGNYDIRSGDYIAVITVAGQGRSGLSKIGVQKNKIKNVAIIGGGDMSFYLAQMLESSNIRVKIIEKDRDRCKELAKDLPNTTIIHGNGMSSEIYGEERIAKADAIVAATEDDEENIIISLTARNDTDSKIITKLSDLSTSNIISKLDLDSIITPLNIAAEHILRFVRGLNNSVDSSAVESLHRLWNGTVETLEFTVNSESPLIGKPFMEMNIKKGTLIAAIVRDGALIIPGGSDYFEAEDSVIIATTNRGFQILGDIIERQ